MGFISKVNLSGSTGGRPILIVATSSGAGTTIHTTGTSSTILDELWIYATNNSSITTSLTIQYGGTGTASEISCGLASKTGLTLILAGSLISGNGTLGATVSAYAGTSNVVNVIGYVNRINP